MNRLLACLAYHLFVQPLHNLSVLSTLIPPVQSDEAKPATRALVEISLREAIPIECQCMFLRPFDTERLSLGRALDPEPGMTIGLNAGRPLRQNTKIAPSTCRRCKNRQLSQGSSCHLLQEQLRFMRLPFLCPPSGMPITLARSSIRSQAVLLS